MKLQTYSYLEKAADEVHLFKGAGSNKMKALGSLRGESAKRFLSEVRMMRNALHPDEVPAATSGICYLWSIAKSPDNSVVREGVAINSHTPQR